jgi:hypothetical protein
MFLSLKALLIATAAYGGNLHIPFRAAAGWEVGQRLRGPRHRRDRRSAAPGVLQPDFMNFEADGNTGGDLEGPRA